MENHLLSWIVWIPVIGMVAVTLIPRDQTNAIKWTAAAAAGIQLIFSLILLARFDLTTGDFQMYESAQWIPSLNITYQLGVDGLSLPMVVLTARFLFILRILGGDAPADVFPDWNVGRTAARICGN